MRTTFWISELVSSGTTVFSIRGAVGISRLEKEMLLVIYEISADAVEALR